ncbi:MAG: TetR/AcrR family transcriptional regulator [Chitinophagaceae bacterium]
MITQSKNTDKKQELLSAALKLFVANGFHGTPTSMIAKEAGVAHGTLFHYFKTKDELVVALYIRIKLDMGTCTAPFLEKDIPLKEKLRSIFTASIKWGLEHRDEFQFIEQFHHSPFLKMVAPDEIASQAKPSLDLLKKGIREKLLKPMDVDFMITIVMSQLFGLYRYLTQTQLSRKKQEALIEETVHLLWNMISTD